MLDSPILRARVAHEFGHYVLGHGGPISGAVTTNKWHRAQTRREMDANAEAVTILMRAADITRDEAVRAIADKLHAQQRAVDRGSPIPTGHLQPAEELRDLLARYPDVAER